MNVLLISIALFGMFFLGLVAGICIGRFLAFDDAYDALIALKKEVVK